MDGSWQAGGRWSAGGYRGTLLGWKAKWIIPLAVTLGEAINIVRELHEDTASGQERLLGKIMAFLQQQSEQLQPMNMRAEDSAHMPVWMPSHPVEGVAEHIQPSRKIRKVAAPHTKSHDIVGRLRASWPGQLYISPLKQYVVVRRIVRWIWRNGYPIYVTHIATRLFNREAKRWRQLTKLSEFVKTRNIPTIQVAKAALVETPAPKVFPACDQDYLVSPHDRYIFPEIYGVTIKNAMTYGGTNLILADGEVVCHDLYDFQRDYTSEELNGRILIAPKSMRIRWLLHDDAPESIPVAATFVDACALNYAHWLTEVLPRIALFCADERFKDVPIVVNDGPHKNIMESLFLVAGANRKIITLSIGRALSVNELYLISVTGYVPFERRTNKLSGHSHGLFSPQSFEMLRNHVSGLRGVEPEAWPEKIFLRRNSGTRKITNTTEIEKLMVARGYVIVEPDKLTFLQQIQLFNNAKAIVAPTGAALSNAIFCKPGTRVAILMAKHENMIYNYWLNMLAPLQVKVFYVLGSIVKNQDRGIHGDFFVNKVDLIDLLEVFGKK